MNGLSMQARCIEWMSMRQVCSLIRGCLCLIIILSCDNVRRQQHCALLPITNFINFGQTQLPEVERDPFRLVVQVPKQLLSISFSLTSSLRQLHPQTGIYILYDSLKQSCCTDVLGAEHLAYDGLVHLGPACFSEPHRDNHHYIFEPAESEHLKQLKESLVSD